MLIGSAEGKVRRDQDVKEDGRGEDEGIQVILVKLRQRPSVHRLLASLARALEEVDDRRHLRHRIGLRGLRKHWCRHRVLGDTEGEAEEVAEEVEGE